MKRGTLKSYIAPVNFAHETLQPAPEADTMESLTQNNVVRSPNSDPTQPEPKACVYTVEAAVQMLTISLRFTYNLCHAATRSRDSRQI